MFGPGPYRPDPTEGMTAIADLPPPEIVPSSRTYERQACPRCTHQAYRDKQFQRRLHDLGNLDVWCPRDLVVTYSQHYCTKCRKYFNANLADLAPQGRGGPAQGRANRPEAAGRGEQIRALEAFQPQGVSQGQLGIQIRRRHPKP